MKQDGRGYRTLPTLCHIYKFLSHDTLLLLDLTPLVSPFNRNPHQTGSLYLPSILIV